MHKMLIIHSIVYSASEILSLKTECATFAVLGKLIYNRNKFVFKVITLYQIVLHIVMKKHALNAKRVNTFCK